MPAADQSISRVWRRLERMMHGAVHKDVSLAKFTTLRVGGPAAILAAADSVHDLHVIIETTSYYEVPLFILGRGSNILVSDDGFPGVVLTLGKEFSHIAVEGSELVVGAAVSLTSVVRTAARHGLAGLAFAVGIPGTVGAAVAVNAGAHGSDVGSIAKEVTAYTSDCKLVLYPAEEMGFDYRHSELPTGDVIVEARFRLVPGDTAAIEQEMEENFRRRKQSQPLNMPSAGSVFMNPEGQSAGALIEQCGCKGMKIGGAQVSAQHANFIINCGNATATDVAALVEAVKAAVAERTGVSLKTELRYVGRFD